MRLKASLLVIIALLFHFGVSAQYYDDIYDVRPHVKNATENDGIIYGEFIQRLGFSSGGYKQHIKLLNLEDSLIYIVIVKKTYKSARRNKFHVSLPPGKYAIIEYFWIQSKWYGGMLHREHIYKNGTMSDVVKKLTSGEAKKLNLEWYTFSVESKKANYVGIWNFKDTRPVFINEKEITDTQMKYKHFMHGLDLNQAAVSIPN